MRYRSEKYFKYDARTIQKAKYMWKHRQKLNVTGSDIARNFHMSRMTLYRIVHNKVNEKTVRPE